MDLLKTLLVYMSLVFATSVQTAPEPVEILAELNATPFVPTATPVPTPTPTPVPTINITPNPEYKALQVGDRGDDVRAMQERLAEYGYMEGEIDGAYGNQTRRAVEKFQYQHGLSVDGIAGRHTLTVLFESDEVRPAPDAQPTPVPTPTVQLALAITPAPTFAPVETVSSTARPKVTSRQTEKPDAKDEAAALELMPEYALYLDEGQQTSTSFALYQADGEWYLPLFELLDAAGVQVIESSSLEAEELAFVLDEKLYRFAYTENQRGEPVGLEVYVNTEPQILPLRDIRRVQDTLYLPLQSMESALGLAADVDENAGRVTVRFPSAKSE